MIYQVMPSKVAPLLGSALLCRRRNRKTGFPVMYAGYRHYMIRWEHFQHSKCPPQREARLHAWVQDNVSIDVIVHQSICTKKCHAWQPHFQIIDLSLHPLLFSFNIHPSFERLHCILLKATYKRSAVAFLMCSVSSSGTVTCGKCFEGKSPTGIPAAKPSVTF